jgi:hypothetical protein
MSWRSRNDFRSIRNEFWSIRIVFRSFGTGFWNFRTVSGSSGCSPGRAGPSPLGGGGLGQGGRLGGGRLAVTHVPGRTGLRRGRSRKPTGGSSSIASPASIRRGARSVSSKPCVSSVSRRRPERRGLHPDDPATHRSMPISIRSLPRRGVMCLDGHCGMIAETEACFRSPSMRQNPSLAGPRNASRRLSGLVGSSTQEKLRPPTPEVYDQPT